MAGLVLLEQPELEPITLDEAKLHCKVDVDDDDSYITGLISAARQLAETKQSRSLLTQTWRFDLDRFPVGCPQQIYLPRPNLIDVESLTYLDTDGETQTLDESAYVVDSSSVPGRIVMRDGYSFPNVVNMPNCVSVTYTAGYGDEAEDVPWTTKQGILFLILHWYENRSAVEVGTIATEIPFAAEALLSCECWGAL